MEKFKTLVWDLLLLVSAFALAFFLLNAANQNYNLVLISVDSLRPDYLNSPNIDKLASSSTVFSNSYSIYPSSVGSYYTLFTGNNYLIGNELAILKYINDFDSTKSSDYSNLTTLLKKNGFNTAAFVSNPKLQKEIFKTGFDEFVFDSDNASLVDKANAKIKLLADRGFFVWVDFNLAKENLVTCPVGAWTQDEYDKTVKEYDQNVKEVDSRVGQLVDYLKKVGLDKNTVVVFYSDKGENFDSRFYSLSKTLDNADIKSVLMVKQPQKQAKEVVKEAIDNSMVSSLILNQIGYARPLKNLQKFVNKGLTFFRLSYGKNLKIGVTDSKFKYVYNLTTDGCLPEKDSQAFYDLIADPEGKNNLIDDPANVEMIGKFKEELSKATRVSIQKPGEPVNVLEKLKSLGY